MPTRTPIEITFELADDDVEELEEEFGVGIVASRDVVVTRRYDNKKYVQAEINEAAGIDKLLRDTGADPKAASGAATLEDLRQKLSSLPDPGEAVSMPGAGSRELT